MSQEPSSSPANESSVAAVASSSSSSNSRGGGRGGRIKSNHHRGGGRGRGRPAGRFQGGAAAHSPPTANSNDASKPDNGKAAATDKDVSSTNVPTTNATTTTTASPPPTSAAAAPVEAAASTGRGGRGRGRNARRRNKNTANKDKKTTEATVDEDDTNKAAELTTEDNQKAAKAEPGTIVEQEKPTMLMVDNKEEETTPPTATTLPHASTLVQPGGSKPAVLLKTNGVLLLARPPPKSSSATESKRKKKKKTTEKLAVEEPVVAAATTTTTATALEKLPPQQVSITASTAVKVRSNTDSVTNTAKKKKNLNKQDNTVSQKAARRFNQDVRQCVERSDPQAMRELLRDKRNHKFALDDLVLEVVLKAYLMAAMFEDALYCLRNCALPNTLSTMQTERILTCMPQNLRNSSAYTAADMINALCIATDFVDQPTNRTYFLRIVRGISLEFLEEATSARDRICSAHCERLVRAGVCVVDARLKRGKKVSDLVVVPGDQLGVFVSTEVSDQRGIATGDAVSILPYAGPYPLSAESLDRNMIEATVINTNPMVLRLQDKMNAALHALLTDAAEGNVYRIDKLANRMGFNRQLAAAVAIASPLEEGGTRDFRRPCPELIRAITAMDENIDRVMRQSNNGGLPKGELTSTAALCAEAIPWNVEDENDLFDQEATRAANRLALERHGVVDGLNASQRLAVEGATTHRLTLVQGPPGTGKTAVAIRILQHWARLATANAEKNETPSPILATSDSNIAVDNLVEGCAAVGLRVIRLGRPEAVRPELLRYCVDRQPSNYGSNDRQGGPGGPSYSTTSNSYFKERMKQVKTAQVICCTCIGSGSDILDALGPLERVLVDEATQATEPAVIVPLMRGCRQLVLVGDHCQLPPTVLSTRAEEEGHGVPLFSRMVACGVPPFMLDTQYRMHPYIAMFPSDLFYGGLLKNGVSPPERRPLAGFPWPREEFPVAFVPVKGIEMDDGLSKYNEAEAAAAYDAVAALLQGGQCSVSDIAVVTPYAAQARLIRRMVRRLTANSGPPFIEVSSVDGFQGREKEAVVFSAVRSNDYGAIGFTSDWRRVNVSFTRARRALIVIGNDQTLRRGDPDTWMPWLAWADAHGLNMDKPGVPRGRYDPEQLRRVRGGTTAAEMLKHVLERQQAQLKTAEKQQERAILNAHGHIMGSSAAGDDDVDDEGSQTKVLSVEEDLALMENADGNWDDSDEEDEEDGVAGLRHSVSRATLTSASSSNDLPGADDSAVDVWDL